MAVKLGEVAAELYALPPGEFTATRNKRAKSVRAEGDQELASQILEFRKPSAAAWAVNMLARHRAEEIEQLLDLGAALREAQEDLDADELRELGRQRHQLIAAVVKQGRALAKELGHPVSEAVATEMGETLQAALANQDAADAVRTGLLTRALSAAGWGTADLADSVAVPSRPQPEAKVTDISKRQIAKAKRNLDEAERRRDKAREALGRIEEKLADLTPRREELVDELDELRRQVAEREDDLSAVDRQVSAVERERDKAAGTMDDAEAEVDEAQDRLDQLT